MNYYVFIDEIKKKQYQSFFLDFQKFENEYNKFIYDFIGNDSIKNEVTNIFKTILFEYDLHKEKPNMGMCNIMITGNPGVGKSTLAVYIGRLFYYFGFSNFFKKDKVDIDEISLESINRLKRSIYIHSISEKITTINKHLEVAPQNAHIRNIKSELSNMKDDIDDFKKIESTNTIVLKEKRENNKKKSDDIVSIFTPADFIAGYVGQTTIKTRELLEKNRNKIIIIDEAYGFATSSQNWFGKEALIEINTYMSEFPNEYLFIFCGYKDLLEKSLIELQPGINRRIKYKFNIEKYNTKELVSIFENKSRNVGKLPTTETLLKIFSNIELSNYAGDIEMIVSKLRNKIASYYWDKKVIKDELDVKAEWIENILDDYKENKFNILNHLYC